jgi:hypothetical protein
MATINRRSRGTRGNTPGYWERLSSHSVYGYTGANADFELTTYDDSAEYGLWHIQFARISTRANGDEIRKVATLDVGKEQLPELLVLIQDLARLAADVEASL